MIDHCKSALKQPGPTTLAARLAAANGPTGRPYPEGMAHGGGKAGWRPGPAENAARIPSEVAARILAANPRLRLQKANGDTARASTIPDLGRPPVAARKPCLRLPLAHVAIDVANGEEGVVAAVWAASWEYAARWLAARGGGVVVKEQKALVTEARMARIHRDGQVRRATKVIDATEVAHDAAQATLAALVCYGRAALAVEEGSASWAATGMAVGDFGRHDAAVKDGRASWVGHPLVRRPSWAIDKKAAAVALLGGGHPEQKAFVAGGHKRARRGRVYGPGGVYRRVTWRKGQEVYEVAAIPVDGGRVTVAEVPCLVGVGRLASASMKAEVAGGPTAAILERFRAILAIDERFATAYDTWAKEKVGPPPTWDECAGHGPRRAAILPRAILAIDEEGQEEGEGLSVVGRQVPLANVRDGHHADEPLAAILGKEDRAARKAEVEAAINDAVARVSWATDVGRKGFTDEALVRAVVVGMANGEKAAAVAKAAHVAKAEVSAILLAVDRVYGPEARARMAKKASGMAVAGRRAA